jgi:hypothetical protein
MRRPTRGDSPTVPRCRRLVVRHSAFDFPGTHAPPLGHPIPGQSARRIARSLCHFLAIGGVPEELFTWNHRSGLPHISGAAVNFNPAKLIALLEYDAAASARDTGRIFFVPRLNPPAAALFAARYLSWLVSLV